MYYPQDLDKCTKHQDRYLGTAQQYTEVCTLLWVQGLAQCRNLVHMYATKHEWSRCTMLIRYLGCMWVYTTCMVSKFPSMPRVELVCINLLCRSVWWTLCYVLYAARSLKLSQSIVLITCICCPAIKLPYLHIVHWSACMMIMYMHK